MSVMWDVQKAVYDALYVDSAFMTLIANKIYDEPNTDEDYPYVVIGQATEISSNRLARKGYENTLTLYIHTKPSSLGFYPAKQILKAMNTVLDHKKLSLTGLSMVICVMDNSLTEKNGDKRIIHARYRTRVHSDTLITY